MKAVAQIKNLNSETCKRIIVRNLSRIMDIRIMEIDAETQTLTFLYENNSAFEKVKRELYHLDFPILQCTYQEPIRQPRRNEYREYKVDY